MCVCVCLISNQLKRAEGQFFGEYPFFFFYKHFEADTTTTLKAKNKER
jgi:hypothetical protein